MHTVFVPSCHSLCLICARVSCVVCYTCGHTVFVPSSVVHSLCPVVSCVTIFVLQVACGLNRLLAGCRHGPIIAIASRNKIGKTTPHAHRVHRERCLRGAGEVVHPDTHCTTRMRAPPPLLSLVCVIHATCVHTVFVPSCHSLCLIPACVCYTCVHTVFVASSHSLCLIRAFVTWQPRR